MNPQFGPGPWNAQSTAQSDSQEKYPCSRCDRTFKRLEHLKRHQRSHDGQKRFVCPTCSKGFARSDVLHRHEFTHAAALNDPADPGRKRACTECARARERCTKGDPCFRCNAKSLRCSYPQPSSDKSSPQLSVHSDEAESTEHQSSHSVHQTQGIFARPAVPSPGHLGDGSTPSSSSRLASFRADSRSASTQPGQRPYQQADMIPGESDAMDFMPSLQTTNLMPNMQNNTGFMGVNSAGFPLEDQANGFGQTFDFPLNWLPANDTVDLDYSSILGLGISSSGLLMDLSGAFPEDMSFNQPDAAVDSYTPNSGDANVPQVSQCQVPALCQDYGRSPPLNQQSPPSGSVTAPSPAGTLSSTSQHSVNPISPSSTKGGLYATSTDGARASSTVRGRRIQPFIKGATPIRPIFDEKVAALRDDGVHFGFPRLDHIASNNDPDVDPLYALHTGTYEIIVQQFRKLCFNQGSIYPAYKCGRFPEFNHFQLFVRLYFEGFNFSIPIIHCRFTDFNKYWPLALAIGTIGCQYTDTEEFSQCVGPLHEFLRRALALEAETAQWNEHTIAYTQALVLSQVGMLYYGSSRCSVLARSRDSALIEIVNSRGLLKPTRNFIANGKGADEASREARWKVWVTEETKRRLGYTIWLLDSMSAYHFGQRPLLSLDDAECDLPHDGLWACKSASDWSVLWVRTERNPSLPAAINTLFLDKEAKADLGEFSRIILLHGIFEEIFKVKGYLNRSLSSWIPSLQQKVNARGDGANQSLSDSARRNTLSNWRNAALDCVDVLHWAANSTIANLAGVEHPTVLHLHLSRVVLLAPYEQIQTLARSIASLAPSSRNTRFAMSRAEAVTAEQEVLQWAQRDEHKARLCVLHCGCLYWHVRRFSREGFYEPISVYLTTLALWAYSSYASRSPLPNQRRAVSNVDDTRSGSVSRQGSPEAPSSNQTPARSNVAAPTTAAVDLPMFNAPILEEEPAPTFIRLDRPNDDEMVQLFVRSGRPSAMRAYITGVGDICSPKGPIKILREGRKILGAVSSAWGRTQEYSAILEAVENVTVENAAGVRQA